MARVPSSAISGHYSLALRLRFRNPEVDMDTHLPEYELCAIRHAKRDARRSDHFIGGDLHHRPTPMHYLV
jgi:hypothetical protein